MIKDGEEGNGLFVWRECVIELRKDDDRQSSEGGSGKRSLQS